MSAGYASRLSSYPNKGICGLPEQMDTHRGYQLKLRQLIEYVQRSKYTVVLTGAGISTSAGIPDFRGPNGIWTVEQQQQQQQHQQQQTSTKNKRKRSTLNSTKDTLTYDVNNTTSTSTTLMNFTEAQPTLTHQIITKLVQDDDTKNHDSNDSDDTHTTGTIQNRTRRNIQFVVTQNVDGLHRRSGLSRRYHCALHGCTFTELCHTCHTEYFRTYDVGTVGFQHTGRYCPQCCGDGADIDTTSTKDRNHEFGKLYDTVLDWEDALPEYDYNRSMEHCRRADLVLCLGTSLRIGPVNELPLLAKQFIIVNLQITPLDAQAVLVLRQRTDKVMVDLFRGLSGCDFIQSGSGTPPQQPILPTKVEQIWKIPVPFRQKEEDNDDDENDEDYE